MEDSTSGYRRNIKDGILLVANVFEFEKWNLRLIQLRSDHQTADDHTFFYEFKQKFIYTNMQKCTNSYKINNFIFYCNQIF